MSKVRCKMGIFVNIDINKCIKFYKDWFVFLRIICKWIFGYWVLIKDLLFYISIYVIIVFLFGYGIYVNMDVRFNVKYFNVIVKEFV